MRIFPIGDSSPQRRWIRSLWTPVKALLEKVGYLQSQLVLVLLYFLVVSPFALFLKVSRDPLRMKRGSGSNWIAYQSHLSDLRAARKQS
jgi:hypothetical protein